MTSQGGDDFKAIILSADLAEGKVKRRGGAACREINERKILPFMGPKIALCRVSSHPWNCLSQLRPLDMHIIGHYRAT